MFASRFYGLNKALGEKMYGRSIHLMKPWIPIQIILAPWLSTDYFGSLATDRFWILDYLQIILDPRLSTDYFGFLAMNRLFWILGYL